MIPVLLLALAPVGSADFEVEPRPLAWEDLGPSVFDLRWSLPRPRRAGGDDLEKRMEQLLELRFELPSVPPGGEPYRSLGDLVRAADARGGAGLEAWLARVLRADRTLDSRWGDALRQLLLDDELRSDDWDPDEDTERDGFLMGSGWNLRGEGLRPWKTLEEPAIAEQGASLVRAELADWKGVENDYRRYPSMRESAYEAIYPRSGSYFRGEDPAGRPFATLALYFRCDLPFPFSTYSCDLRILNRLGADGRLETDIYSTSADFHWMAGRDVFLPVEDSAGERVAYLVVRTFGFDLDGVPDGRSHRQAGLRQSLGHLKRWAEAARREREGGSLDEAGRLPEFRVLGRR